ncbi:MAG: ABC transporter permease [Rhodobacteraceae bacterium]|nr:ABC transporter permease [Paracoccaceae bacterium]
MNRVAANLLRFGVPVLASFLVCGLFFSLAGYDVWEVTLGILEGAVTGPGSFRQSLRWSIPMVLIALGFMISFRTGEFNIGGQGQLMLGGLGAVAVALIVPGPQLLILPLAILTGICAGALWSAIAGLLKLRYGADEVITTLMLNFIAVLFIQWVTVGPLRDEAVRGQTASTKRVDPSLRLTGGDGISPSMLVLVALAILVAWLIAERTPFGLKSRLVGANPVAAMWQGVPVKRIRLWAYLLAGGFAGLAGALEVLGPNGRLVTDATPTIGFTAIVVAIVGMSNVPGIVLAALLFGGLQASILFLPIVSDLPSSGLRIVEGLIAAIVTARFFHLRWRKKQAASVSE